MYTAIFKLPVTTSLDDYIWDFEVEYEAYGSERPATRWEPAEGIDIELINIYVVSKNRSRHKLNLDKHESLLNNIECACADYGLAESESNRIDYMMDHRR